MHRYSHLPCTKTAWYGWKSALYYAHTLVEELLRCCLPVKDLRLESQIINLQCSWIFCWSHLVVLGPLFWIAKIPHKWDQHLELKSLLKRHSWWLKCCFECTACDKVFDHLWLAPVEGSYPELSRVVKNKGKPSIQILIALQRSKKSDASTVAWLKSLLLLTNANPCIRGHNGLSCWII